MAQKKETSDLFCSVVEKKLGVKCVREYRFHPTRRWRFDYAIEQYRIALEVEGGAYTGGRHTRGKGFIADMEKYNTATVMGWMLLRTTPSNLMTSTTIELLKQALYTIKNNGGEKKGKSEHQP